MLWELRHALSDGGQAGGFGLLRLDRWVQSSGASLYHSPRGRTSENIWLHPIPWPYTPGPAGTGCLGDAWERAVLTDSVLTFFFFFPKRRCLVSQPTPIAGGWSSETWVEGVCTDVETEKPKEES